MSEELKKPQFVAKKDIRDTMHRCPYCKKLSKDTECLVDEKDGRLICPSITCPGPRYEQPPYESPFNYDYLNEDKNDTQTVL